MAIWEDRGHPRKLIQRTLVAELASSDKNPRLQVCTPFPLAHVDITKIVK